MNSYERLEALVAEGGIQTCGNAQNCVKVCPKEIPLDHGHRTGRPGGDVAHDAEVVRSVRECGARE